MGSPPANRARFTLNEEALLRKTLQYVLRNLLNG